METLIENVQIADKEGFTPGSVLIRDGIIADVLYKTACREKNDSNGEDSATNQKNYFAGGGAILSSGFIDLHCHGGNGSDVNDATDEAIETVGRYHLLNGTTSWCPTLSVDPIPVLEKTLLAIEQSMSKNAPGHIECLGAHFESPWISGAYKGCQAVERILPFDNFARGFLTEYAGVISRLTLAPELDGVLDFIPRLRDLGIVVSGGHSNATADLFTQAADRGMTMVTHLYNAMSKVHKEGPFRVCGVLEASLTDDRLFTEIICDGFHVPVELIHIARRCKGRDRLLLCSDANRGAGLKTGGTIFTCGQEAIIENGVAMLKDRSSLASSVTPLSGMVRFLVTQAGLPVHEALYAASFVPAAALGIAHKKGSIEKGKDADMVLLDANLAVRSVWRAGVLVS